MRKTQVVEAAGFGILVFGCFGPLPGCGSGSGNNGDDPTPDAGRGPSDATTVLKGPESEGGPAGDDASSPPPQRQACQTAATCSGSGSSTEACCGGYCVDTATDPNNCGKCGNACSASQFCTGAACDGTAISNVCANPRGTVAADAYAEDTQAGAAMGMALSASCTPPTMILQTSQNAEGILDPGSGRPITGPGDTFITGGGGYGQNGVAYMEASITPLYLWGDGTTGQIRTRDGAAVVNTAVSALTAHHDFFYVQVSVEPQSGTLCLSAVGMLGPGTTAAGYYAGTELIPNRSKYTSSWYVYEWQDTNNDSIANAGDTFTQVMAGP
jgi:Stigma-specific protein, Stig1